MLASGVGSSDYFPLLVDVWEWFRRGSAMGSRKAYLSEAQTPREMFIKQMCSFCLETCPAIPVLNIKNKLSCQGKNIMHNLILIFQYSVSIFFLLEITKELLLNETVQISELVFLDNINWKNWLHSKALYFFLFCNGSTCMYVLCFSFLPPLPTPKNFSS